MEIYIKWYKGSMVISLEAFLSCRSITKVKKLLTIIRTSNTPECEGQIKAFIEQELEQYEPRQKENQRYIVGYESKVNFLQKQIENCMDSRDRFKPKSDGWKHYNSHVKTFRDELREIKVELRKYQKQFSQNEKNKEFYMKVLEVMSQGG